MEPQDTWFPLSLAGHSNENCWRERQSAEYNYFEVTKEGESAREERGLKGQCGVAPHRQQFLPEPLPVGLLNKENRWQPRQLKEGKKQQAEVPWWCTTTEEESDEGSKVCPLFCSYIPVASKIKQEVTELHPKTSISFALPTTISFLLQFRHKTERISKIQEQIKTKTKKVTSPMQKLSIQSKNRRFKPCPERRRDLGSKERSEAERWWKFSFVRKCTKCEEIGKEIGWMA